MSEVRSERAETMLGAVLGSYRITGVLAAGGMGTVFKGKHDVLGRQVAIKLLRRELTSNDEIVQRFWAEARAATAIKHPGIIEVVDFGYSPEGRAYLVMELLAGESLATRLSRGRLSESDAIQIARSVATALVAAHAKTIVHRDLKPDNIFLVSDAEAAAGLRTKILDFGVAKLQDGSSQTQTGALIGTPLYMAPEQARSARAIDHRADLYSLGCILYEMLAGQPPFVAPGAGELIAMHMFNDVPPLKEHVTVAPELDSVVMRLLEKDPDARFQSAQALVDAFIPSAPERATEPLARLRASGQVSPAFTATAPKLAIAAQADDGGWNAAGAKPKTPTTETAASGSGRSMIPIVAGAVTVGLAALVLVLVLGRSDDSAAAPVAKDGSALVEGSGTAGANANAGSTGATNGTARTDAGHGTTGEAGTAGADGKAGSTGSTNGTAGTAGVHGKATAGSTGSTNGAAGGNGKNGTTGKHTDGRRGTAGGNGKAGATGPVMTPSGPVTTPSGPVTSPGGPVTTPTTIHSPTGSPLETTVDDDKPKPPPSAPPPPPAPAPTPATDPSAP